MPVFFTNTKTTNEFIGSKLIVISRHALGKAVVIPGKCCFNWQPGLKLHLRSTKQLGRKRRASSGGVLVLVIAAVAVLSQIPKEIWATIVIVACALIMNLGQRIVDCYQSGGQAPYSVDAARTQTD
jgi:hypothetical protein